MERRRHKLIHPYVDEVSVVWGEGAYADYPDTVEIAFIKDEEFYEKPIEPFEKEFDGQVYSYVDVIKLTEFLVIYGEGYASEPVSSIV